ncbi:unnamed protein product [Rotaria sp. Silwood2]|nr:unnamed protein product [Rotaria sp. Silwood2]CAF3125026.1 unnamed protein product [Rotaria sp. Silwood2]CAF4051181.1 unnamed protein product [Rotaria sp. Silwood2]CAF4409461.1 unnamed protein product [Rotaria sp. Silwood2]
MTNYQSIQSTENHGSKYRLHNSPMTKHQPSYPSAPIGYRATTMSPVNRNQNTASIPPLMSESNLYQPKSPTVLTPVAHQQNHYQNKTPVLSSPAIRRRLNDSSESQQSQQYKKHRSNDDLRTSLNSKQLVNNTLLNPPQNNNPILVNQQQYMVNNHFPLAHLKRAVSNNLPYFYLKFDDDLTMDKVPSSAKIIHELNQFFYNKWVPSFKGFTVCSLIGKNRFKIGTNDKADYSKLISTQWPGTIDDKIVELIKPNHYPDCFSFVVRHIPVNIPNEHLVKYIYQVFKSAVKFTEIKHYKNNSQSTKDFLFTITDIIEYYTALDLKRIDIGNQLLPLTQFRTSYKLTYCTKCWRVGHMRYECNEPTKCRICLDKYEENVKHRCQGSPKCAQCDKDHWSLDNKCEIIRQYRQDLKSAVEAAVTNGKLQRISTRDIKKPFINKVEDFPVLVHSTQEQIPPAWNIQKKENIELLNELQKINGSMNGIRDDIETLGKKLIEENDKRLAQDKLIHQQQQNIVLVINQFQIIIKSLTEALPELDNKVKKKIEKQVKTLTDIGKKISSNEVIIHSKEQTSPHQIQTNTEITSSTTTDIGRGNENEKLNMSIETINND